MRAHGAHVSSADIGERHLISTPIEAGGPDWRTALDALYDLVPEGHELVYVTFD